MPRPSKSRSVKATRIRWVSGKDASWLAYVAFCGKGITAKEIKDLPFESRIARKAALLYRKKLL